MSMTICYSDRAMNFPEAVGLLVLESMFDQDAHGQFAGHVHLSAHLEDDVKAALPPQHRVCHEDARLCVHCTLQSIWDDLRVPRGLPIM